MLANRSLPHLIDSFVLVATFGSNLYSGVAACTFDGGVPGMGEYGLHKNAKYS